MTTFQTGQQNILPASDSKHQKDSQNKKHNFFGVPNSQQHNPQGLQNSYMPHLPFSMSHLNPLMYINPNVPFKSVTKPSRIKKLDIYSFNLDERIGKGYSSVVYRGFNDKTKEQVCIKIIDYLALENPDQKEMISNEIKILKLVDSPYILKCLDVLQSKQFCYIITEICPEGDLFKILHRKKYFSEKQVLPIVKGIALALLELKSKKIIHRDLKPSNVLMKSNIPKLADFGFSIQQSKIQQNEKFNLGSPIYMSLQVLKHNQYSYSSDIFAFGILVYQLLHTVTPWECNTESELIRKVQTQPITFKQNLSKQIQELIRRCLDHNVSTRITIQEIVKNPLLI